MEQHKKDEERNRDKRKQGQQGQGEQQNPAENLSQEDRIRGGEQSAREQMRDDEGQFAGKPGRLREQEKEE